MVKASELLKEIGKPAPIVGGILETLSRMSLAQHDDDIVAVRAPGESERVPMLERGVTLAFLKRMKRELEAIGRGDADAGQFLNGRFLFSPPLFLSLLLLLCA